MNIPADKQKAIESAMVQIERQFGKGSIMKLGSKIVLDVPVNRTALCRILRYLPRIPMSW
jgi:recombination protein RecA